MATSSPPPKTSLPKDLATLKSHWNTLYQTTLPNLARSKAPSQSTWPVHLDHCFARIILDAVVGTSTLSASSSGVGTSPAPWTDRLKSPAINHMSAAQLENCITLGEAIAVGKADLVELDEQSLAARGKAKKGQGSNKRKVDGTTTDSSTLPPRTKKPKTSSASQPSIRSAMGLPPTPPKSLPLSPSSTSPNTSPQSSATPPAAPLAPSTAAKIASHPSLTPFRRRLLRTLCQVPRGQYTTYLALSNHLGSSPRAAGNALRNNPFAPEVPCHRVVAADGGIGGFGGEWGVKGKHNGEKVRLLREEGVRVEKGDGRVMGNVWTGFT